MNDGYVELINYLYFVAKYLNLLFSKNAREMTNYSVMKNVSLCDLLKVLNILFLNLISTFKMKAIL